MKATRRGFLGVLFAGGAAAPILLKKGERVIPLSEARDLTNVTTHVSYVTEDGTEIPVSPTTMVMQSFDGPSVATFNASAGAYKLGQRVKLSMPEYGVLFSGRVMRITMHVGHLCQYEATTELDQVKPVIDIRHQNMDDEMARRVSDSIMRSMKSTRRLT